MTITPAHLTRWTGLAGIAAGVIFIGIQPIHPADVLESTTTGFWSLIMVLKTLFTVFGLIGITGVYVKQAACAGVLGFVGYLVFGLFFLLQMPVAFIEAVVLPPLATLAPAYVSGLLGSISGAPSTVSLGAFPAVLAALGALYLVGGTLFGVATFRAGVMPRWAGGLLVFAVLVTLAGPLLGHPLDRALAVPMGVALAWLGYSVWTDTKAHATVGHVVTSSARPV